MKHNNLISIVDMSKLSGVHIKSLRYYDHIGVLKPAWIDPETGYRFYAHTQLAIVDAIQTCVELDIPLKQFSDFAEKGGDEIHYARLLEHGKTMAKKKIRTIRARIRKTELYQKEIARAEILCQNKKEIFPFPARRYYTEPVNANMAQADLGHLQEKLFNTIVKKGYTIGYDFGLLYRFSGNQVERFLCVEILPKKVRDKNVMAVPAASYFSKFVVESKIEAAPREFSELFALDYPKMVFECELFTGNIRIHEIPLELRCSIPVGGIPAGISQNAAK